MQRIHTRSRAAALLGSLLLPVLLHPLAAAANVTNFIAYNDFGTVGPSATPVTSITVGALADQDGDGDYEGSARGELLNYATGEGTGVILDFMVTNSTLGNAQFEYGANAAAGEARDIFGGIVDCVGCIYGGNTAAQRLRVTLSGLDPVFRYELVLFSDRAYGHFKFGDWYRGRYCAFTISGAASFTNASTPRSVWVQIKTQTVPDDTAVVDILHNGGTHDCYWGGYASDGYIDDGAVCRFADVDPGPDGEFTVTLYPRNGPNGDTSYYPNSGWSGWGDEIHINALRLVEAPKVYPKGLLLYVQ